MSIKGGNEWAALNRKFVEFGRKSGLFDEVDIRKLGDSENDPFQIRVRPGNANAQAPFRNLADVGYGVSQILPVLTELLRSDGPRMFLLQQPEIHLHPSAQAALGNLVLFPSRIRQTIDSRDSQRSSHRPRTYVNT